MYLHFLGDPEAVALQPTGPQNLGLTDPDLRKVLHVRKIETAIRDLDQDRVQKIVIGPGDQGPAHTFENSPVNQKDISVQALNHLRVRKLRKAPKSVTKQIIRGKFLTQVIFEKNLLLLTV